MTTARKSLSYQEEAVLAITYREPGHTNDDSRVLYFDSNLKPYTPRTVEYNLAPKTRVATVEYEVDSDEDGEVLLDLSEQNIMRQRTKTVYTLPRGWTVTSKPRIQEYQAICSRVVPASCQLDEVTKVYRGRCA